MFIRLLRACARASFCGSLASDFEGQIKCISLNNWPFQTGTIFIKINFNKRLD